MRFSTAFSIIAALAAPANAYFILSHPVLETTRLDPIVSPGVISGHVHSVVGGNNFDKTMTYNSTQQGTCTTATVSVDKSNYWTPQLYYYSPTDDTYEAITVSFVNTYYLPRYSSGETTVRAFPDGLRMTSGDPYRRTYNNDADSNAISYVCLDYDTSHSGDTAWDQRNSFFEHNCPNGMRAQVNFRSCWDGVNLDSDDHQSHMAWPSGGVDGGDCPSTHPVRLVSLFYEFIYNVQDFPYNGVGNTTWVWSFGDVTGYGFHGDFVNGWPAHVNGTNVLQEALDECNDNNGVGGELAACAPFVPYLDSASAEGCTPLNDLVNEDIGSGHTISRLPGDNPLWIGNSTTKPSWGDSSDSDIGFTDFKSTIPDGYTEVGCMAEGTSGRALTGASFSATNMTRGICVQWCEDQGYPLAGMEYGSECYCGVSIRNGASNTTLLADSECNYACADNDYENCGGSATLSLFNNPSLYQVYTYPTGWSSSGCMTEATNARALAKYSVTSDSMTPQVCIAACQAKGYTIAGIEYSSECYCANAFSTGSVAADDSSCSMSCSGDALQTCGGSRRLSTWTYSNSSSSFSSSSSSSTSSLSSTSSASTTKVSTSSTFASTSKTSTSTSASTTKASTSTSASKTKASTSSTTTKASTTTSKASTTSSSTSTSASATSTIASLYVGCYSDSSPRHLDGSSYTSSSAMTNEACISYCGNLGFAYSGTEYASECHCGNIVQASLLREESHCKSVCTGDATEVCGWGGNLSIYETGVSATKRSLSAKFRL
ncbi:WSC domain-containing protein [Cryptococcus wingfieldii CBS 7118]|uniref:WSC domain-containing protein n=1 Tax=Cryptococcus wingfieldii CBS 7118 TaxID=1295528 RepID=A0A1E3IMF2_9TREE|nr:WSC domain-containing protein [Cryptococcus wingfieldii CBS 7118]ODN89698.1 WSC domain-containing protein [Cryptococcus wingfieldii CBS 7118]